MWHWKTYSEEREKQNQQSIIPTFYLFSINQTINQTQAINQSNQMPDSKPSQTTTTTSRRLWQPQLPPGDNNNKDNRNNDWGPTTTAMALTSSWPSLALKALFSVTVGLYILNQKHLLPLQLSRIVSKTLFWPTLPITVVKRLGSWTTPIDDTVVMGGAPLGFAGLPERLYQEYGVSNTSCFSVPLERERERERERDAEHSQQKK